MHRRHYVVIDFECIRPNEWQSVGIIVYEQRGCSGRIIRQISCACDRGTDMLDTSTSLSEFWRQNQDALEYNRKMGHGISVLDAEVRICKFVEKIKRDFPHFYLVSDNPEYDIGIMNQILIRHGLSVMSQRTSTIYHQSICTWSTRRALEQAGIRCPWHDHVGIKNAMAHGQMPHTPVFDCMRILNGYLNALSSIGGN